MFSSESIHDRIGGMAGRPAEGAFLRWQAEQGYGLGEDVERYGAEEFSTKGRGASRLEPWVLHAPDFVTLYDGNMWECQGYGQDRIIRVKHSKLEDLHRHWHSRLTEGRELRWFFWCSDSERFLYCDHESLLVALNDARTVHVQDLFPNNEQRAVPGHEMPEVVLLDMLVVHPWAR